VFCGDSQDKVTESFDFPTKVTIGASDAEISIECFIITILHYVGTNNLLFLANIIVTSIVYTYM